jgi:hypothetical protein
MQYMCRYSHLGHRKAMYHLFDYTSACWLISWLRLVEGQPWLDYWLSWLPQSLVDLNQ